MDRTKIHLHEEDMPDKWYNIQADLKEPLPAVYSPRTLEPATPEELSVLFPMELLKQEMSTDRYVDIPEELKDILRLWRPSPLYRARRLENALKTPAKIYYKWEGVSPPGSHKPNTAIAQAYYNKLEGTERIATETGAGQWGSSLAFATQFFDIECKVYMVKVSYEQKPYRRIMMETWGANCVPSPSKDTQAGQKVLAEDPDCPGSLGIAISEAVEDAATHENTKYSLGSVLNHVCMHQTVIGQESMKELEQIDTYPDVVIGCVGGGSNFAGIAFPYIGAKLRGEKKDTKIVAAEPTACPTLTKGVYAYDYGDSVGMGPIAKMYTLGHDFVPAGIHAGGLRYHGDSPIVSKLVDDGLIEAVAYHQIECFEAAQLFAKTEGFIVAPETSHAVKAAVEEAKACKESGEEKVILFNNSGHGHFDLGAYDAYHSGKLVDYEYPKDLIEKALAKLPKVG